MLLKRNYINLITKHMTSYPVFLLKFNTEKNPFHQSKRTYQHTSDTPIYTYIPQDTVPKTWLASAFKEVDLHSFLLQSNRSFQMPCMLNKSCLPSRHIESSMNHSQNLTRTICKTYDVLRGIEGYSIPFIF